MCSLRRQRSGRHPARSSRSALAPTLARTSIRCEAAHVQPQAAALWPSPCSLVAGCAGSYAARTSVRCEAAHVQSQAAALWPSPCSLVAGCASSYAGAHLCKVRSLRRRRSGRRLARSSRAALAPMLARTSVRCEAARVRSQAAALWPSPCSLGAGCAGSSAGAHLDEVRGCTRAVSGGGALAVALLARRGLRWLLRWRAPR